jgi:hypothetical protein
MDEWDESPRDMNFLYDAWLNRKPRKQLPPSSFPQDRVRVATNSLDATLNVDPHYTDNRYQHMQTVYGREHKGLKYDYSDRLRQWDYQKDESAHAAAKASGAKPRTARYYNAYLSAYFGQPTEVKHILAGWNVSTGYSYQLFGYRDLPQGPVE